MRAGGLAAALATVAAPAAAQAPERVRCVLDNGPPRACTVTFGSHAGVRTLHFDLGGGQRVTFAGRAQTGWWSGKLDGKPAMGFERNRGFTVFSTLDLARRFEWYYPGSEHGTY